MRNLSLSIALATVLAGSTAPAAAQIVVKQANTAGTFSVAQQNEAQFRSQFTFGLTTNISQLADKEIRIELERRQLATAGGIAIKDFTFDRGSNLVIGTSTPGVSVGLSLVAPKSGGTDVVVAFRDGAGNFVKVEPETIGVFTLEGRPVDFGAVPLPESAVHLTFEILLDKSGSMAGYIEEVKRVATEFMASLPVNASCRVTAFNSAYERLAPAFKPCTEDQGVASVVAGGGTNIYVPLLAAYRDLAGVEGLKAVVLLTDGVGASNITKDAVLQEKSAPTHVMWLGAYDEQHLKGIADTDIRGAEDRAQLLSRYFAMLGAAAQNQQVITVRR